MTRFRNRIAVWSSLHEPVLIYGSFHRSVFKSRLYPAYNEHESESGPGLLQLGSVLTKRIRSAATRNQTHELTQTYSRTRIHSTIYTHTHTCTPTYIRIQVYTYTNIHAYLNKIPTHEITLIQAHIDYVTKVNNHEYLMKWYK